jgi:hypothetical protein
MGGGGMQGMAGMGGGMGGMRGMGGGGMQGTVGVGGGMRAMAGMGGGAGTGPAGMQVMGGSQEEIGKNMKQALSSMQDMAMKQIQSKYPGMPITMKADDGNNGGEESGEEPTVQVQQGIYFSF